MDSIPSVNVVVIKKEVAPMKKLYRCDCCHQTMNSDNFYKSNNLEKYGDNDGYLHICKKCLTMHLDP